MYPQRQTSVIRSKSGNSFFSRRTVCCTIPLRAYAWLALLSLVSGMPNSSTAGTPARCARSASFTISSGENCDTPGIAPTGRRSLRPGRAKSGSTSCSALSRVSATSRRSAGDWRSRRRRRAGNSARKFMRGRYRTRTAPAIFTCCVIRGRRSVGAHRTNGGRKITGTPFTLNFKPETPPAYARFVAAELSIIVPVYNEADNILPLAREVGGVLSLPPTNYELVFVDDASTDSTWQKIVEAHRLDGRVRGLRHARQGGQSAAIWTGIQATRGPVIATLDGDRQNDPADLPRLLAGLEKAD